MVDPLVVPSPKPHPAPNAPPCRLAGVELFRLEDMWEASLTNSSFALIKARLARYNLPWAAECRQDIYHDARTWLSQRRIRVFEGERHKNKSLYYSVLGARYREEISAGGQGGAPSSFGGGSAPGASGQSRRLIQDKEMVVRSSNDRAYIPYGVATYLYSAAEARSLKAAIGGLANQTYEASWGYLPL